MADDPIPAQLGPYQVEVEEGKRYFWCRCGRSKQQPFCDGSHGPTEFRPQPVQIEEAKKVALCTCKRTSNPPFCDGTHAKL